jgi:hypothetical protein
MKIYYPGTLMIPTVLLLIAAMGILDNFGIIQFARAWSLWPVSLIATGLEEVYLWATTKEIR